MIEKHTRGADTRRTEGDITVTSVPGAGSLLTSLEASLLDMEVTDLRPVRAISQRGLSTQSFLTP